MDGPTEQPNERLPGDPVGVPDAAVVGDPGIGMSRRAFTTKVGAGSAAALGMVWATPRISTIRFAAKAAVGSPGPTGSTTSTSTTSTSIGGEGGGSISVSTTTPCAGDHLHVRASGFAPKTAVALELDSAQNPLGITTADGQGRIDVNVVLREHGPTGPHEIIATGVRAGGRTLTLSVAIRIRTADECRIEDEGTTSTTGGTSVSPESTSTSVPPTTTATTAPTHSVGSGGAGGGQGGTLAFTGTDAIDLTIVGAAATVGGRLLYGLARPRDDEDDDDDD